MSNKCIEIVKAYLLVSRKSKERIECIIPCENNEINDSIMYKTIRDNQTIKPSCNCGLNFYNTAHNDKYYCELYKIMKVVGTSIHISKDFDNSGDIDELAKKICSHV
jgi:hypothetical protein